MDEETKAAQESPVEPVQPPAQATLVPGISAAIRSISSIASPELTPAAACPEISNAGTP